MQIQKIFNKTIKRKNFFTSLGTGFLSYAIIRAFPFNLIFNKNENFKEKNNFNLKVKINPNAVSRKKLGDK